MDNEFAATPSFGYICWLYLCATYCSCMRSKDFYKKTNAPQVKLLTCHEHKNIKLLIFLYFFNGK